MLSAKFPFLFHPFIKSSGLKGNNFWKHQGKVLVPFGFIIRIHRLKCLIEQHGEGAEEVLDRVLRSEADGERSDREAGDDPVQVFRELTREIDQASNSHQDL